jgi:hypothetical protein
MCWHANAGNRTGIAEPSGSQRRSWSKFGNTLADYLDKGFGIRAQLRPMHLLMSESE